MQTLSDALALFGAHSGTPFSQTPPTLCPLYFLKGFKQTPVTDVTVVEAAHTLTRQHTDMAVVDESGDRGPPHTASVKTDGSIHRPTDTPSTSTADSTAGPGKKDERGGGTTGGPGRSTRTATAAATVAAAAGASLSGDKWFVHGWMDWDRSIMVHD